MFRAFRLLESPANSAFKSNSASNSKRPEISDNPESGLKIAQLIAADEYRVAVGDVLSIIGLRLGTAEGRVQPNGMLSIEGWPAIRADGKTVDEIETLLNERVESGRVRVAVSDYRGNLVHVIGGRNDGGPSAEPLRAGETLTEFSKRVCEIECRWGFRVRIVRPSPSPGNPPDVFSLRVDKSFAGREGEPSPPLLRAGDCVYIERDVGEPGVVAKFFDNARGWTGRRKQQHASTASDQVLH